jgi:hypothetical protein
MLALNKQVQRGQTAAQYTTAIQMLDEVRAHWERPGRRWASGWPGHCGVGFLRPDEGRGEAVP